MLPPPHHKYPLSAPPPRRPQQFGPIINLSHLGLCEGKYVGRSKDQNVKCHANHVLSTDIDKRGRSKDQIGSLNRSPGHQ